MVVRRLDSTTGDIVTSGTQFLTEQEEIAQTIRTRLRLFTGEYFRDITDGTPWYDTILDKNSTQTARDAAIKRRILQTDGVSSISEFESDYDISTRSLTITATVITIYGIVELEEYEGTSV